MQISCFHFLPFPLQLIFEQMIDSIVILLDQISKYAKVLSVPLKMVLPNHSLIPDAFYILSGVGVAAKKISALEVRILLLNLFSC